MHKEYLKTSLSFYAVTLPLIVHKKCGYENEKASIRIDLEKEKAGMMSSRARAPKYPSVLIFSPTRS
jgi:hypothetical protein